jgi:pyruvate formate-lyase/glycerol dehydratase family glycyl radical enzyme
MVDITLEKNLDSHINSSRVQKLRDKAQSIPEICLERAYLITESYKETEAFPQVIRRAKALKNVLDKMTITIEDDELIVGRASSKLRGGPLNIEVNWESCKDQVEAPASAWDIFSTVPEDDQQKMEDVYEYWKGRCLFDKLKVLVPEDTLEIHNQIQLPSGSAIANMHIGSHISVDYEKVLSNGLYGIKQQVDKELSKLHLTNEHDFQKHHFLTAVNITLEAASNFAVRYSKLARSMAEKEMDAQRRMELNRIADICEWVPGHPARDFYEALQSVWFVYLVLMNEGWGPGMSFGRPDQYLYPFYKKDIEEGNITREQVRELLALFCIKINHSAMRFSFDTMKTASGLNVLSNVTLGGITRDGRDAVNELSYIFLDATKDVKLHADEFVVRIHKNTSESFLLKACETAKSLRGKLKFCGDETAIQQLMSDGKPLEDARDYIVSGCVLPTVPGRSFDIIGGQFNLPLMLELALNNGYSRLTGKRIGPQTGDPREFKTYDDVWNAYKKQVEALIPIVVQIRNIDRQLFAEYLPTPFQSALFHGCIEKGLDITNGGTLPYVTEGISVIGVPNVGDSLAAIKKLVFEDRKITLDHLIDALDKNFEGEDELLSLLKTSPKYGNDDDYVDLIVKEVFSDFIDTVKSHKGFGGTNFAVSAYVAGGNIILGALVGALPDGRGARLPLSEGGVSPHPGRNVRGATSTMRSVTKLDIAKLTGGAGFNMKFNPELLKDESKMKRFASMIRTYFETGGYHVQFNIVSTDMLKDAQKHPEQYQDLLVRVATYSAFFVQLGPECQKEIIDRTEFQQI